MSPHPVLQIYLFLPLFKGFLLFYMYEYIHLYMAMCGGTWYQEKGTGSPDRSSYRQFEQLYGCWEQNDGSLQEQ